MAISDTIESMYENTENAYDKVQEKGGTIPVNKNLQNLASAINSIVTGGGVSTQSQSIFTGYTAPLTWLNSTNNVFKYESATHNITIDGLSGVATISGNGTKSVTVTINTSLNYDNQIDFTITCVNGNETLTYNGIAFHYGTDVTSGNCLAVAQTLNNGNIEYIFIESNSLPLFSQSTTSWNNIYSHQLIGFDFAKWNGTTISDYFLSYCYSFNQPLTIPNSVHSIANSFLRQCNSFNQSLTISNDVTSIGQYFLYNCYAFNQPFTIPHDLYDLPADFFSVCYSFNQPLTIPNSVHSIGNGFFGSCYSFNQSLTMLGDVTSIGNNFLNQCRSFNQPLTIPNTVTTIGSGFLSGCNSFSQPLTIPDDVTSIGSGFLNNCNSFIYLEYNASVYPTDNSSLSQNINTKTSSSGTGIKVLGANGDGLKTALPNRTSNPYRKLV